ncbi:MAG TPA: NAD-dependent epimerase/dehydratase family protein [Caldilineaceae bacterium]|nr:NAD-dependent epimerase/dehydratase family protein [Caldilineaceae bacterium]
MNVLVTGGAGFIGSHVADALLAAGHRVVIVDNLHTGHRRNLPAGATFYQADITDAPRMAQVFEAEAIDAISHQAALANVRESMADPISYAQVNVVGSLVLLELARKHNCRKFVFASTGGAVYGEGDAPGEQRLPFHEGSRARPLDNYGANKLSVELHLDLYQQNYKLPTVALRYANIYGPRQDSKGEAGVVAIFVGAMLAGAATRITGDGGQTRDFTYVGDVARANLLALESACTGVYNIGTGVPTDINTLHRKLAAFTGYDQAASYVPRPVGEVRATYLDNRKAAAELGWQPQVSLDEGLQRTIEWARRQGI